MVAHFDSLIKASLESPLSLIAALAKPAVTLSEAAHPANRPDLQTALSDSDAAFKARHIPEPVGQGERSRRDTLNPIHRTAETEVAQRSRQIPTPNPNYFLGPKYSLQP